MVTSAEADRQRLLLARIAAEGILGHNVAVEMPGEYSEERIRAREEMGGFEMDYPELMDDLAALTDQGLLFKRNTGHAGYANSYVEGPDVWKIEPAGMVALWT